ncbi:MAG TPA: M28 family peptidase [Solirubrobacteraceae bacterium]|nr:M28 family peptidase [Solirubrobacteraceae bacterium]
MTSESPAQHTVGPPVTAADCRRHDAADLRATIEALAAIPDRGPCSPGEHTAAHWIAERLRDRSHAVDIEQELAYPSFAGAIAQMSALGALAGVLALSPRTRPIAVVLGLAAAAGVAEDVSNGPRLFRRLTMQRKPTWNVVAEGGDPDAERAIVLLAHHDAAPTGHIFDPTVQKVLGDALPGVIERIDTSIPLWWPVIGFPALSSIAAARGSAALARWAILGSSIAAITLWDIAHSPITPGANDNLSGVAAMISVADALAERPVPGIRVLFVSCGSEEVLQGGIHGFAARHFPRLDRERTSMLNLETLGSPELIMLEGEGPVVMEDYHARGFRDRVARAADRAGVHVRRGMRSRSSTDSVIPSRAGYPTATLASMDRHKWLTHYHLMSDLPEHLDYATVADAALLAEAVVRELAAAP